MTKETKPQETTSPEEKETTTENDLLNIGRFNSMIEKVNKVLEKGEPENITVDDSRSGGLVFTGYKPQAIIDAVNEVFGFKFWGFKEEMTTTINRKTKKGEGQMAVTNVSVWLFKPEYARTAWGQNNVINGEVGDAKKAAQTDGIKKALSYFSIGKRAYLGLLEKNPKVKKYVSNYVKKTATQQAQYEPKPQYKSYVKQETPPQQVKVSEAVKPVTVRDIPKEPPLPTVCEFEGCNTPITPALAKMMKEQKGKVLCVKHAMTTNV